ncbi:hypothetical protein EZJ49_02165 [Bdellovibrio bacteriovorus]|uniref:hypothetical protein n=1 Tax=Bdellovibrio bacteriovorus TaxID=959 RepID=UPI0021CEC5B7|nr:hypothetical protein [Bdellovibrio bacteriovorus]UXR65054.1 hypothetical protein EZJ49_02165 [Bdellovibrio bacteriovorus]
MGKWILILLTATSLFATGSVQAQPMPLPDEPYPGEPNPSPNPPPPVKPPPRQEIPYSLGGGDTGRFRTRTFDFFPRFDLNRIVRIRLVGTRNNIEIKEVLIQYADYSGERQEFRLPGELKSGGIRETVLDGRAVYRIQIKAANSHFWKKPGGFRVDVIAVR